MTDVDGSTVLSIVGSAGVGVGRTATASLSLSAVSNFGTQGFPPGASLAGGTYFQRMMARDPVAYWRFGGNLIDSAHGHNGYLAKTYTNPTGTNTAQYGSSLLTGDPNPSLTLQAQISAVVTCDTWADLEEFTFEGFFEITGTLNFPSAVVARASVDHFGWGLILDDTNLLFSVGVYTDVIDLPWGFYHYVVTGAADEMKLYLNGLLVSTQPYNSAVDNADADFQFGATLPGYNFEAFPGRLDEFAYFAVALSGLDVYADWEVWELGQEGSIPMVSEVDSAGMISPRLGNGQTYRRVVAGDDAWSFWSHVGVVEGGALLLGVDNGDREHHATVTSGSIQDLSLGPTQAGPENPVLLANFGKLQSVDDFTSAECTISAWVSIGPKTGSITVEIPLLCMAPSQGASTFDKCLYLDTSGRLCWLTDDGSPEVITDPDPLPQDGVARHVAVSVGPAGTKIRVSGTTKVTGANTTSLTTPQKVFYFNGGTGGGHDFTTNGLLQRQVYMQATIFDDQLSDAQTDKHWGVGRSMRNIERYWGLSAADWAGFGAFNLRKTGFTVPQTGQPSIIPSDPQIGSSTVPAAIYDGGDVDGTWIGLSSNSTTTAREIRHVVWEPSTTSGVQELFGLWQASQQFVTSPAGYTSLQRPWRLYSNGGVITWDSTTTNFLVAEDHFTHSVAVTAGRPNAVGLQIDGATVDIWVNGVKETFTRPRSTGWSMFTVGGQIAGYNFGGIMQVGAFTLPEVDLISGKVADLLYNNQYKTAGLPSGDTSDYLIPERFFEDLNEQLDEYEIDLPNIIETETVFELIAVPAVTNQAVTLDMVADAETAFAFHQAPPQIETIIEIGEVGGFAQPQYLGVVTTQGAGQIVMVNEDLVFLGAELRLNILETTVYRAPTSITVTLAGGVPQEDVVFAIDGTPVLTVSLDSNGELGPTSINLSAALGAAGDHDLSVSQTTLSGVTADTQAFTVLYEPSPQPDPPATPVPPVDVPGAVVWEESRFVRRWVFQDLLSEGEGGLGEYIFPANPASMGSPHYEYAMTSRHSTAQDGKIHVFQAGNTPKEWTFTGYCPSQDQQARMTEYRNLNRRFYIIDHRNRAWTVVVTDAQFVPRLRQTYNGVVTDWGSDYTFTAVVLDQDYQTPEEA